MHVWGLTDLGFSYLSIQFIFNISEHIIRALLLSLLVQSVTVHAMWRWWWWFLFCETILCFIA